MIPRTKIPRTKIPRTKIPRTKIPRTNGKLRWCAHPVTPRRVSFYGDDFIWWGSVRRVCGGWLAEGPIRSRVRKTIAAARRYVERQVDEFLRVPRDADASDGGKAPGAVSSPGRSRP